MSNTLKPSSRCIGGAVAVGIGLFGGGLAATTPVRANAGERACPLPGDELIADAIGSVTHASTIRATPRDVWPWLVQMGAGRAGWYSYGRIDNGGRHSAERIRPALPNIAVGTVFPALPGVTDGYVVVAFEPEHSLVLGWPLPGGGHVTTWAFVLDARAPDRTRLIARSRAGRAYHFSDVLHEVLRVRPPEVLSRQCLLFCHFVMQRKQLLGIARRVECHAAAAH